VSTLSQASSHANALKTLAKNPSPSLPINSPNLRTMYMSATTAFARNSRAGNPRPANSRATRNLRWKKIWEEKLPHSWCNFDPSGRLIQ
jgi:hypothetical protein